MQGSTLVPGLVLITAMGLSACGGSGSVDEASERLSEATSPPPEGTATPSPTRETIVEWISPGWSSFVHHSDAAVVGEVTAISDAFRLADRREEQDYDDADRGRHATLQVDRVIFDSEDLQVARGENVEVLLLGDGTNTGPRVPAAAIERFNAISGPVDVGDEVLWVLTNSPGFVDEGSTILLRASYLGNWRIENGRAVNALPARSLPRDELVRLLREERAAEYRPDDNRGAGDPREVEEGSPN